MSNEVKKFESYFKGEVTNFSITFDSLEDFKLEYERLPKDKEEFVKYKNKSIKYLILSHAASYVP